MSDMAGGAGFTLRVTPDGMEAWIDLAPGVPPRWDPRAVHAALAEAGVRHGILENVLRKGPPGAAPGDSVLVAAGEPPLEGASGFIECLVTPGTGDRRMDGSADARAGRVLRVRKGQRVLRHVMLRPGLDGLDVRGRTLPAAPQKDCPFPVGPGLAPDPDYDAFQVAGEDGVLIARGGGYEVRGALAVPGDVGPATGNVDFPGRVIVKGSVLAGYRVSAQGGLEVGGTIEAAEVRVEGNVLVREGILGTVVATGTITARHAENARLEAEGDVVVEKAVLNSAITAGGAVRVPGGLVSGSVFAGSAIETGEAGSPGGARLWLRVGWPLPVSRELQEILAERGRLEGQLASLTALPEGNAPAAAIREDLGALSRREQALLDGPADGEARVAVAKLLQPDVRVSIGPDSVWIREPLRGPLVLDEGNVRRIQRPVAFWVSSMLLMKLQQAFKELGFLNQLLPADGEDWPPRQGILCLEPGHAGEKGRAALREAGKMPGRKVIVFATGEDGKERERMKGVQADAWVEAGKGGLARGWAEAEEVRGIFC